MCAELAELGMALARIAAQKAVTQFTEPEQAAPPPKGPDPATLFVRLSNGVRQCIALEARIGSGHPAHRLTFRQTPPAATPTVTQAAAAPAEPAPTEKPAAILAPLEDDDEEDPFEAVLNACPDDESLIATLRRELGAAAAALGVPLPQAIREIPSQATGPPGAT